jgi:5'-3' exonuclease
MVALIDFDSILYTSVYKVVSFSQIREAIELYGKDNARQWMKEEVLNEGVNRAENTILQILEKLNSMLVDDITGVELFITTCTKSFRKQIDTTYKAKRKRNSWVWLLRDYYLMNDAKHSDTHEADDLIADRVEELGRENCVVVSIDKDLKQIGGYYWSYYKENLKNADGTFITDEFGVKQRDFKYHEVEWIDKEQADYYFWEQMLVGDNVDNIKGIKGIGIKRAEKLLKQAKNNFIQVARCYLDKSTKEHFRKNYQLLKLGK